MNPPRDCNTTSSEYYKVHQITTVSGSHVSTVCNVWSFSVAVLALGNVGACLDCFPSDPTRLSCQSGVSKQSKAPKAGWRALRFCILWVCVAPGSPGKARGRKRRDIRICFGAQVTSGESAPRLQHHKLGISQKYIKLPQFPGVMFQRCVMCGLSVWQFWL